MENIIEIEHLCKSFGSIKAVDDLSFSVKKGELFAFLGVNGAGKSSLTGSLRAERTDLGIVVDPDQLTAQCGGDEYEGGKLAVQRIETALADGVNFTQETTLSGGYPKRLCRRAKQAGYFIRLYYVGLDTAEESLRRIKNRP